MKDYKELKYTSVDGYLVPRRYNDKKHQVAKVLKLGPNFMEVIDFINKGNADPLTDNVIAGKPACSA